MDNMIDEFLATEQQVTAEQAVIGAILIDDKCLNEVRNIVKPDMFSIQRDRDAFAAACTLQDEGKSIDPVTIGAKIREIDSNTDWTNSYALDLITVTATAANVLAHCDVLKSEYMRRVMLHEMSYQTKKLMGGNPPKEISADMMEFLDKLSRGDSKSGIVSAMEAATELISNIDEITSGRKQPALPTGYRNLDDILGEGLQRNGFYILAARPGCGKTTFALNVAYRVAVRGRRVLFISLEMDREQLVARILASEIGGISPTKILNGMMKQEEMDKVVGQSYAFSRLPIFFNLADSLSVSEIKYLAKLSKADLVVIDYLGLIESQNENGKLYEEVTKNSKRLKLMARSLGVPVLCLAQMNRESEKRNNGDKKPKLSDLRDSGSIEQDADAVIFHYIDSAAKDYATAVPDMEYLDLIVAKNRHGRTDTANMIWSKKDGKISEAS